MMVCYNRLDLTKQMLSSLLETTNFPFHLVVIDNASTDGTVDWLDQYLPAIDSNLYPNFLGYKFIKNNENKGIATGRNQGLYHSFIEDNWLCTIDNDVILPQNWLNDAVSILTLKPTYGCIGVNFEDQSFPLIKIGEFEIQHKKEGNLGTACMVFNRKIHKMLGYFNNKDYSKFYGCEDACFGFRVRVSGLQLGYLKENGIHLGSGENDKGEYREFKTREHDNFKQVFFQNCREYLSGKKSLYFSYSE